MLHDRVALVAPLVRITDDQKAYILVKCSCRSPWDGARKTRRKLKVETTLT